jgi:hypothetical protein
MRDWYRLGIVVTAIPALISACTMKYASVPPEQLMKELQAGQPILDCRVDCGLAWGNNRQQAAVLDATGQWRQLALLVMQIGYMNDLTYYYLGRAAENLGYLQAAQRYYRIAEQISVTNMSCHQAEVDTANTLGVAVNLCDGHAFPDALYPHLAAVESQLAAMSVSPAPTSEEQTTTTTHTRRARRPSHVAPVAASTSVGQNSGSGFVVPQPSEGSSASGGGSGFVEPSSTASNAAGTSSNQFAIPPVTH